MQTHVKESVHRLTNMLQLVLSHIEMEDYKKALEATRNASKELRVLARMLLGITHDNVSLYVAPKGSTIVVPSTAKVVTSDEIKGEVKIIRPKSE